MCWDLSTRQQVDFSFCLHILVRQPSSDWWLACLVGGFGWSLSLGALWLSLFGTWLSSFTCHVPLLLLSR